MLAGIQVPPGLLEALRQPPLPNFIIRCADGRVAGLIHPYAPEGKVIVMSAAMSVEDFDEYVTEGRCLPHRHEWQAAQRLIAQVRQWAQTSEADEADHRAAGCDVDQWGCVGGCSLEEQRREELKAAIARCGAR